MLVSAESIGPKRLVWRSSKQESVCRGHEDDVGIDWIRPHIGNSEEGRSAYFLPRLLMSRVRTSPDGGFAARDQSVLSVLRESIYCVISHAGSIEMPLPVGGAKHINTIVGGDKGSKLRPNEPGNFLHYKVTRYVFKG